MQPSQSRIGRKAFALLMTSISSCLPASVGRECGAQLLAIGLVLVGASKTLADPLPLATWECGPFTDTAPGDNFNGRVVTFHDDVTFSNSFGNLQSITDSQLVLSEKPFDSPGIVRPSADGQAHLSWTGAATPDQQLAIADFLIDVDYHGRIDAKPGAPNVAVPLVVHIMGSAKGTFTNFTSFSFGKSLFECSAGTLSDIATAGSGFGPHNEYDDTTTFMLTPGDIFHCFVQVHSVLSFDLHSGSAFEESQAIADPDVQIDPSFEFKDFFTLEYSSNLLVPEPSSATMAAVGFIGIIALASRRRAIVA